MANTNLTFYGGVGTTTGANFLVEFESSKFLVDCGLLQGVQGAESYNSSPFQYDPKEIKVLFITHAHIDHIGRIPKLVKDGFKGQIFSTPETKEISGHLLEDALRIMLNKRRHDQDHPLPYEERHIREALDLWDTKEYREQWQFAPSAMANFKDAGHILGSAMVELKLGSTKIVFTGDLGNSPSPLLADTEGIKDADYIVVESVYGDRNHESQTERRTKFKQVILETIERKGEVVIPAFSVDRTQVILYELNNMVEDGEIPSVPVFLDSPLASKITEIYKKSTHLFNDKIKKEISAGDNVFDFPQLKIIDSKKESLGLGHTPGSKIIIAGSGMSEGGRVLAHEARILGGAQNTLLLMGYQSVGSLGRKLEEGAKEIQIWNEGKMERLRVRARVENVHGYSAHKDSTHLIEFVEKASSPELKKVFVVLGEPRSSLFLAQRLRDYVGVDAIYPETGKTYDLT